jgi:hypothetical protein
MTGHNALLQMHLLLSHWRFFEQAFKISTSEVVVGFRGQFYYRKWNPTRLDDYCCQLRKMFQILKVKVKEKNILSTQI